MRRLCIFCGAATGRDTRYRDLAESVAQTVVKAGYGIVYGGGRIGLMGAVADAALANGGDVIGVIPRSLASTEIAHQSVSQLHVVESMHERKALMVDLSDAFIALPGGFGTMDEFHEIVTWRQLHIHDKPIGLLNAVGFYDSLIAQFTRMNDEGFLHTDNRRLFETADSIDALLARMDL